MIQSTIESAVRNAQTIDFGSALNQRRLTRNRWILAAGIIAIVAFGVTTAVTRVGKTWFNRNILLGDMQWPQRTYLEIEGVQNGQLIIDRGANYELNVVVGEASRVTDVDVNVEFDSDGKRTMHDANPTGQLDGRQRQLLLHNVSTEFRLRAMGGDAVTDWVQVRLVEPIDLTDLQLVANLPEYIGGTRSLSGGGPYSILLGSRLSIRATANIDLQRILLRRAASEFPARK